MKYLEDQGIIDLDDVREKMERDRRRNILAKHEYSIFQDKDGRWKTTIKDSTKKNGKRLIARKDRRDLEDFLIDYLDEAPRENATLRQLYLPWLKSRKLETKSINTVDFN